jgi:hypothetical protein
MMPFFLLFFTKTIPLPFLFHLKRWLHELELWNCAVDSSQGNDWLSVSERIVPSSEERVVHLNDHLNDSVMDYPSLQQKPNTRIICKFS